MTAWTPAADASYVLGFHRGGLTQNVAGSNFMTLGVLAAFVVTGISVALFVRSRIDKRRRAGIRLLVQRLDGRPLAYVPYAEFALSVPDALSTAQAHGYALTPNPVALRYEFARGAPQTAFTGNPRAAYVAQMLDGRPLYRLAAAFEELSLPELMVLAHSRGYTVQLNQRYYEFVRYPGRP